MHHSHSCARGGRNQIVGPRKRHIRHPVGIVRESRGQKAHYGRHDGLGQGRWTEIV